jgi:hypothetical protein
MLLVAVPGHHPFNELQTHQNPHLFHSFPLRALLGIISSYVDLTSRWRRHQGRRTASVWGRNNGPVKTSGRLVKHARSYWVPLAESHLARRLSATIVRCIAALSLVTVEMRLPRAFLRRRQIWSPSLATGVDRDGKNDSNEGGWMYTRWWPGGQTEILVHILGM